jgi:Arc/MetJ family transcription regulator
MHTEASQSYGGKNMRTTLNIEDNLIDKAAKITGIKEKTALVKLGLEALIARESARRLARLGEASCVCSSFFSWFCLVMIPFFC